MILTVEPVDAEGQLKVIQIFNCACGVGTVLFLANICYLFDNGYSSKCEVVSHCGCDLHFPDNQ